MGDVMRCGRKAGRRPPPMEPGRHTTWPRSSTHALASTRRTVIFSFLAAATTSIWSKWCQSVRRHDDDEGLAANYA